MLINSTKPVISIEIMALKKNNYFKIAYFSYFLFYFFLDVASIGL